MATPTVATDVRTRLDLAWYGLQEQHGDIGVAERFNVVPYSVKPAVSDQSYNQDWFQSDIRLKIHLHEVTARRLGRWHTLPRELYADEAAQDT